MPVYTPNQLIFVNNSGLPISEVDLPAQLAFSSADFPVVIQNVGQVSVSVTGQILRGDAQFQLLQSAVFDAFPGVRYEVPVRFSSNSEGEFTTTFVLSSNHPYTPVVEIPLRGHVVGIAPSGELRVTIDPTNLTWSIMQLTVHAVDSRTLAPVSGTVLIKMPGRTEVEAGLTNNPFSFNFDPRPVISQPGGIGVIINEKPQARITGLPAPYTDTTLDLELPPARPKPGIGP